jgi:hypothetical protein
MSRITPRAVLATIFIAIIASGPALAELPRHVRLQTWQPLPEEQSGPPIFDDLPNEFGFDLAIRNGLAFVGMPLTMNTGQVAVFTQGTKGWTRTATIIASDRTSGDEFGRAVSFRDGLVVVGSARAAYVFKQVDGVWREQQKIVRLVSDGGVFFARGLKQEAGVLAIRNEAAVYIFERGTTGKFERRARFAPPAGKSWSGNSISMTKREIVFGSPPAAYVLGRNSSGQWIRQQRLVPLQPKGGGFGETVAIDRGMILVADRNAPNGESAGLVYGFVPGQGKYVEAFQLSQPDEWPATRFGESIAMFGTRFAVGATEFDDDGGETPNRAFVATYSRDGSVVRPLGFVQHSTVPTSIGIANNVMLVGSPLTGFCVWGSDCIGEANLYDLSRFEP